MRYPLGIELSINSVSDAKAIITEINTTRNTKTY
jgi:hypothetical protein